MANVFEVKRTAECAVSLVNTAATMTSGSDVFIPAGAIVTGVRVMAPAAITIAGAQATVQPRVGAVPICSTQAISAMPAVSVPATSALLTADGVYIGTSGEFLISLGTSVNSGSTGTYNYYIDYIIPAT